MCWSHSNMFAHACTLHLALTYIKSFVPLFYPRYHLCKTTYHTSHISMLQTTSWAKVCEHSITIDHMNQGQQNILLRSYTYWHRYVCADFTQISTQPPILYLLDSPAWYGEVWRMQKFVHRWTCAPWQTCGMSRTVIFGICTWNKN